MRIARVVIMIFTAILVISSYFLIKDFMEYKENDKANMELIESVITEESEEEKMTIDWEKLENINRDVIGWIRIEDTKIDYPIMQDSEKLKYIKCSFDGKYNSNGSIFTVNHNPFEDNVTIIYGHNMKNGSMFSNISKYMNEQFFKEHSTFNIYTKNQNYIAKVFSVYSIEVNTEENNIKNLSFDEEIEYYKNTSKYFIDNIGEIKKIVKLSTCSYLGNHTTPTNQRYFLVASLEKVD